MDSLSPWRGAGTKGPTTCIDGEISISGQLHDDPHNPGAGLLVRLLREQHPRGLVRGGDRARAQDLQARQVRREHLREQGVRGGGHAPGVGAVRLPRARGRLCAQRRPVLPLQELRPHLRLLLQVPELRVRERLVVGSLQQRRPRRGDRRGPTLLLLLPAGGPLLPALAQAALDHLAEPLLAPAAGRQGPLQGLQASLPQGPRGSPWHPGPRALPDHPHVESGRCWPRR
jgi:hypothetical protein